MFLGIITLLTALVISGVAAYYSIVGLTAIFAAAFWPIVIMGTALEVGKVVSTVWLHYNWERASLKIKAYLVPAVIILMIITSLGIFGFLSRAHLEQTTPAGDVQEQVALFDEKIRIQRDNIADARSLLTQLDKAVADLSVGEGRELRRQDGTTYTQSAAERALSVRRSQARDRAALTKQIEEAQAEIVKLQEAKAPVASKLRKVEAEVGPIKYVAALIYGDEADHNMLEAAVRWVIIIIVVVFDPLAIVLILAATTSIDWAREARSKKKEEEAANSFVENDALKAQVTELEHHIDELQECLKEAHSALEAEIERSSQFVAEKTAALANKEELVNNINEVLAEVNARLQAISTTNEVLEADLQRTIVLNEQYQARLSDTDKRLTNVTSQYEELQEKYNSAVSDLDLLRQALEEMMAEPDPVVEPEPIPEPTPEPIPDPVVELTPEPVVEPEPIPEPVIEPEPVVDLTTPEPEPVAQPEPTLVEPYHRPPNVRMRNADFGVTFPKNPSVGDMFVRVDYNPNRLFKWAGTKWIEIDKSTTDSYTYDDRYINLLIKKLESGEYNVEDLNDAEKARIEEVLAKGTNNGKN